jgi:hypothetical protein
VLALAAKRHPQLERGRWPSVIASDCSTRALASAGSNVPFQAGAVTYRWRVWCAGGRARRRPLGKQRAMDALKRSAQSCGASFGAEDAMRRAGI